MRISIFGLGYVGSVTGACLAERGHEIIGVDSNLTKVGIINAGRSPIIEEGLEPMIAGAVRRGGLRAVTDSREAIASSDLSLICVGTPSLENGSLDLSYVERVSREIGRALKAKARRHLVVVRSTVLPGTTEGMIIPAIEEESGKKFSGDFGVCSNPEFLRESTSVNDFNNPPKTVIGSNDPTDTAQTASLYGGIDAPLITVSIRTAEIVKYVDNVFHALKVTFGNEIGRICQALGIDSHEVMEIFCLDTKLNLSSYYLRPGFAFGGPCLPKDLRAMVHRAQSLDVDVPVIRAIAQSNEIQMKSAVRRILALGKKKIGVLGFAFKAGTDDLRESPVVELIETLLGKGCDIRIYDSSVNLAKLFGANKDYIERHIPHIANFMTNDLAKVMEHAEVIIVGNPAEEFKTALQSLRVGQYVFDLVRVSRDARRSENYEGMSW